MSPRDVYVDHSRDHTYDRDQHDTDWDEVPHAGVSPGKRTRTSRLGASINARQLEQAVTHVMRQASGQPVKPTADQAVARARGSAGRPLPRDLRAQFSQSLGIDLDAVRVHTGADAADSTQAVGAKAYALGNNIYFGAGEYDPASSQGQHLIAHEVVHTVQQSGHQSGGAQYKLKIGQPDSAHEIEADQVAHALVAGRSARVAGSAGQVIQRTLDAEQGSSAKHVYLAVGASQETAAAIMDFGRAGASDGDANAASATQDARPHARDVPPAPEPRQNAEGELIPRNRRLEALPMDDPEYNDQGSASVNPLDPDNEDEILHGD